MHMCGSFFDNTRSEAFFVLSSISVQQQKSDNNNINGNGVTSLNSFIAFASSQVLKS